MLNLFQHPEFDILNMLKRDAEINSARRVHNYSDNTE
jgi:hypothetical protein